MPQARESSSTLEKQVGAHAHGAGSKGLTLAPTGEGTPPTPTGLGLAQGLSRPGVSARPPDIQAGLRAWLLWPWGPC